MGSTQFDHLLFELLRRLVWRSVWARRPIDQAGFAFGVEPAEPSIRALAAHTHCFGDMSDGPAEVSDSVNKQTPTTRCQTGITVRHEDLLDRVKQQLHNDPGVFTFSATCHQRRARVHLDLGPFDPRDASDLFARAIADTQMPSLRTTEKLDRVAHVLSSAWLRGRLTTPEALRHFYRLAVQLEYPDNPGVMRLYLLHDEWDAGWGRSKGEIESEIAEVMTAIGEGRPFVPDALLDVVIRGS